MKGIPLGRDVHSVSEIFCSLIFILTSVLGICAQEQPTTQAAAAAAAATPVAAEPGTDALQRRITRARSLAAAGKLGPAASELEALRTSSADESVRDVARILLMWIYVEMPDYTRASALLDETFKAHETENQTADRAYFALAGQTINSVRTHLDRYRTFGINITDSNLPGDAASDLEQLRRLLEKLVEQARAIRDRELKRDVKAKSPDATALLEDAATVRLRLARGAQEQADWQREVADARQRLVASETRIARISGLPTSDPAAAAAAVNASTGAAAASGAANSSASPAPPPTTSNKKSASEKSNSKSKSSVKDHPASSKETKREDAPSTAKAPPPSAVQPTGGTRPDGASQKTGAPVAVGALAPLATQKVSPSYPLIAKTARVSGLVRVYVVVNEKGTVESVERADGPVQLQAAATDAARRWKFRPTLVDGQPVRVAGFISFNFAL